MTVDQSKIPWTALVFTSVILGTSLVALGEPLSNFCSLPLVKWLSETSYWPLPRSAFPESACGFNVGVLFFVFAGCLISLRALLYIWNRKVDLRNFREGGVTRYLAALFFIVFFSTIFLESIKLVLSGEFRIYYSDPVSSIIFGLVMMGIIPMPIIALYLLRIVILSLLIRK
ncbi:hypothetical protein P3T43_007265 [Paraburkholderia sp. GAS41]|uniref:hypothetical protein n=1 Tax=Paraburkholderia sp. GAS41 TaxID=3035134 RepID=UPI003D242892